MASKQAGAVLTILGGVFYIIGSLLGAVLTAVFVGMANAFPNGYQGAPSVGLGSAGAIAVLVFGLGIFSGAMIIVGGALLNSDSSDRRKAGGVLAIAMMIIGAIPTFGGFLIGFILTLIGSVIGLTYKQGPDVVIGTMAMPPQGPPAAAQPGPSRFCPKCGLALQQGAVFCGSCGAPVGQG